MQGNFTLMTETGRDQHTQTSTLNVNHYLKLILIVIRSKIDSETLYSIKMCEKTVKIPNYIPFV